MSTLTATIPSLPDASALDGTEVIELSQADVSVKTTLIWRVAQSPLSAGTEVFATGEASAGYGNAIALTGVDGSAHASGSYGGDATIKAGAGGAASSGYSHGGKAWLIAGDAVYGYNSSYGGEVRIRAGSAAGSHGNTYGGKVFIQAGSTQTAIADNAYGGSMYLQAGGVGVDPTGKAYGGSVKIYAGNIHGGGTQKGGDVILKPGANSNDASHPGHIILKNLPTSSSGLPSGAVWRDAAASNVVKAVP